jgi:hypothetical protein
MTNASFPSLLKGLSRYLALGDEPVIEDNTYACLVAEDGLALHFRVDPAIEEVILLAPLARIPPYARPAVAQGLAEANYLWRETGGATLSIDPKSGHAVLGHRLPLQVFDQARFNEWVERFASNADVWRQRVDQMAAAELANLTGSPPPSDGASTELPRAEFIEA